MKKIKCLRVSSEAVMAGDFGSMNRGFEIMPDHPLFNVIVSRSGYHEPGEKSPKPFEAVYEESASKEQEKTDASDPGHTTKDLDPSEPDTLASGESDDSDDADDASQSSRRRKRR